ncbi:EboA domain-containing protein [Nocardioides sp. SYSU D00065]|uniref:EboA domain-containing protein n=1 Tax=Nocardioides sp. SYSU D00065 TaxID=2817378 RepID=UPI001B340F49|nr:EboA domain-containing protein [Nocardioides sp. SYSU D00065]
MTEIRPLAEHDIIRDALDERAQAQWEAITAEVAEEPTRLGRTFPAAARKTGRGPLPGTDGVLVEDAVRVSLVQAAARSLEPAALLAELREVYRYGDNDEKRAVLHALSGAPEDLDGSDLLLDALRTNDTRLVAAAMGPHSDRLDDDAWRQGVLKCLFTGVPVTSVTGLARRADHRLAEMVQRYQREREAAGRDVPSDVQVVLDACRASLEQPEQHRQKDS